MDLKRRIEWYDGYKVAESIPLDKRELYRSGDYDDIVLFSFWTLVIVGTKRV